MCLGICPTSPRPPSVQCCFPRCYQPRQHGQPEQLFGIRTAEPPRHPAEEILRARITEKATLLLQHCLDGVAGEVDKYLLGFLEGLQRNCQQFLYSQTQMARIQPRRKKTPIADQNRPQTRSDLD